MGEIAKVGYTHEALINWMIEFPHKLQKDAALYFGITEGWLSQVVNSDAFRMQLKKRQDEVFSVIAHNIPEKLNIATSIALDKLTEKLTATGDGLYILDAAEKLLKANGYAPQGQRTTPQPSHGLINQTVIINSGDLDVARKLMEKNVVSTIPQLPEKVSVVAEGS